MRKIIGLAAILLFGATALVAQNGERYQFPTAKKSGMPTAAVLGGNTKLVVKLNGIQGRDFINLRPGKSEEITVRGGSAVADANGPMGIRPNGPLPESAFNVDGGTVQINRPTAYSQETILFADVEIPTGMAVQIVANGSVAFDAKLDKPLAYQNGQLKAGKKQGSAVLLGIGIGADQDGVVKGGYTTVEFGKLILRKGQLPVVSGGTKVLIGLVIDKAGKVIIARSNLNGESYVQQLKQCEFEPYRVNGEPVGVVTTFTAGLSN